MKFKIPPCPDCGGVLTIRCLDNVWYANCVSCAYTEFDASLDCLLTDIREYASDSVIQDGEYVAKPGEAVLDIPLD